MGTILDTTVFIQLERLVRRLPADRVIPEVRRRLDEALGGGERVGISAITASELLHGMHRATPDFRPRREAFVESVLRAFPPRPFGLTAARVHANLWANLAALGSDIGPHDRIIAATALTAGWRVGTANIRHFERIPGLEVVPIDLN